MTTLSCKGFLGSYLDHTRVGNTASLVSEKPFLAWFTFFCTGSLGSFQGRQSCPRFCSSVIPGGCTLSNLWGVFTPCPRHFWQSCVHNPKKCWRSDHQLLPWEPGLPASGRVLGRADDTACCLSLSGQPVPDDLWGCQV